MGNIKFMLVKNRSNKSNKRNKRNKFKYYYIYKEKYR